MAKNDKVVRVTQTARRLLKSTAALHGEPMWKVATAAIVEYCTEAITNWSADEKPEG